MLQAIFSTLTALLMALAALTPAQTNRQARLEAKPAANPARDFVIRIVERIKRAGYEGDRVALIRVVVRKTRRDSDLDRDFEWRGISANRSPALE